jgi:nucleoside-diphosphate-sugar epimerase
VILRPFNTYGIRQSARAVIPTIISQALTRNEIRLGNLTATRDLTYVTDTCEGFVKAAESATAPGEVIQLGTGRDVSVAFLAETILKILGKQMPVVTAEDRIRPEASEIDRLLSSPEKASSMLGWKPTIAIEEGLAKVVDWMKENVSGYRTDKYVV